MQLADRVAVMNAGRLEQVGAPEEVFNQPDNTFTAEFFGKADFLPAWRDGEYLACEVGSIPWSPEWGTFTIEKHTLQVMVRPDCLDMEIDEAGNGLVVSREFLGAFNIYAVDLASGHRVKVMQSHIAQFEPGSRVRVYLREGHRPIPFANGYGLDRAAGYY